MIRAHFSWIRWLIVWLVLWIFAIISIYVQPFDFLPPGKQLFLGDYLFSTLSSPLVIAFVIPLTYCYLISDLYIKDTEGEYIALIMTRLSNRTQYLFYKFFSIISSSLLFLFSFVILVVLTGLLFRLLWKGPYYFQIIPNTETVNWIKLTQLLFIQANLILLLLVSLGLFTFALSLFFKHVVAGYAGVIALIVQGHGSIFDNHAGLIYTPLAQGVLVLHAPYYFYGLSMERNQASMKMIEHFTPIYSTLYFFFVIAGLLALCLFRIKTMNMSDKG